MGWGEGERERERERERVREREKVELNQKRESTGRRECVRAFESRETEYPVRESENLGLFLIRRMRARIVFISAAAAAAPVLFSSSFPLLPTSRIREMGVRKS